MQGDFPEIMERWIAARRAAGGHRGEKKICLQVNRGDGSATTTSRPTAFVLHETFEEFQVASSPIGQTGFLDHDRRGNTPGESRLVNELNVYKEEALLEFVFPTVCRNKLQHTTNVPLSACPIYRWTTQEPNPRPCREHRDIVCRARAAWVSAFFFSYDFCSFPGPQLSSLGDHELRIGKRLSAWCYCREWGGLNPSCLRCSIQLKGMRWVSFLKLRSGGWRPSRIASTMSGARKAHSRTRPTYRWFKPSICAMALRPETSPDAIHSCHWRPRARAFNSDE